MVGQHDRVADGADAVGALDVRVVARHRLLGLVELQRQARLTPDTRRAHLHNSAAAATHVARFYIITVGISKQIKELNVCWNNVIGRIVGYQRWESVKAVIYGLGRLNVTYELIVRKLKFYKSLYFKSGLLHDVFWAALLSDRTDDCLRSVFYSIAYSN